LNTLDKFLIYIILFLQISCLVAGNRKIENNVPNNKSDLKNSRPSICEETAVLIAQGYMFNDYEMSDFNPKVETENELYKEFGKMWRVTFISKGEKTFGDPVVWV
jgi:hypothetical protein